jgi:hypothetical protein
MRRLFSVAKASIVVLAVVASASCGCTGCMFRKRVGWEGDRLSESLVEEALAATAVRLEQPATAKPSHVAAVFRVTGYATRDNVRVLVTSRTQAPLTVAVRMAAYAAPALPPMGA